MTDRHTTNLSDDEVRAALNALVVKIQQKQDSIDALMTTISTVRTEKNTVARDLAALDIQHRDLKDAHDHLEREHSVLEADAKITLTWLLRQMRIGPLSLSTRTGSLSLFRTLMASPSADVPILTRLRKFTLISAVKNLTAIIHVTRHGVKHAA